MCVYIYIYIYKAVIFQATKSTQNPPRTQHLQQTHRKRTTPRPSAHTTRQAKAQRSEPALNKSERVCLV